MLEDMDNEWLKIFHKFVINVFTTVSVYKSPELTKIMKEDGFNGIHNFTVQLTYAFVMEKFSNGELNEEDSSIDYTEEEIDEFFEKTLQELKDDT